MKKVSLAILLAFSILLSACDGGTPNCSAEESTNLVKQILDNESLKKAGADVNTLMSNMLGLEKNASFLHIHHIRTVKHDKDRDVYLCEASFIKIPSNVIDELGKKKGKVLTSDEKQKLQDRELSANVTYSIEKTDDGKHFIVNVLE